MDSDPTAWFDQLYAAAGQGEAVVPWDRGTPNALLVEWVEAGRLEGRPRAMVVGAGYGRDSEYLASLGLATSAFDISPSAVAQTRGRFPDSSVQYAVADLLALPEGWHQAYGLVVEIMNVQALPRRIRERAIPAVSSLVAPGGRLLVIEFGHDGSEDPEDGPPWPLSRAEVESFGTAEGLEPVEVEGLVGEDGVLRWRAEFRRR